MLQFDDIHFLLSLVEQRCIDNWRSAPAELKLDLRLPVESSEVCSSSSARMNHEETGFFIIREECFESLIVVIEVSTALLCPPFFCSLLLPLPQSSVLFLPR